MAKRGPGKFNNDLDAAIYSLSLDGGPDEEAGSSSGGDGWYGLMRDGLWLVDAIKDRQGFAPEEVEGVSAADLEFLCTKGTAGAIIFERTDGIVEVTYYSSKTDLDKDWAEVEEKNRVDDEEFEENPSRRGKSELTPAQQYTLDGLVSGGEYWWHDLPAKVRETLYEKGLIREVRKAECGTPGHKHPGYVGITELGKQVVLSGSRRPNTKLPKGYTKYGAQMGRQSTKVEGKCTLELVRLDTGGYDSGGAYWGTGEPLWRAEDEDGNEQFFRAASREAAKRELPGCTIVSKVTDRSDEFSLLETDGTLAQLLEEQAESEELPREHIGDLEITPELSRAAQDYEAALHSTLVELTAKYPPKGAEAGSGPDLLIDEYQAPYQVYAMLAGSGITLEDANWDELYDEATLEKVKRFLKDHLGSYVTEFGSGKLVEALHDAVYENEQRLGIERDDDGNIIEREENRRRGRRRNGSARFRVYLNGEVSDTVYFNEGMSESEVKRSLIDDDGFDPRITVKKVEPRRTGIPAEAYIENRRMGRR